MGRLLTWLLTTPILVVSLFAGHELGYRIAHSHADERARALEESGHDYFSYAPFVVAALVAIAVVGLGLRVRAAISGRSRAHQSWAAALLAPLAFVMLEVGERLYQGESALAALTAPEVIAGLVLQLPFALAALFVARLLTRFADAVGVALRSPARPSPRRQLLALFPVPADLPRIRVVALPYGERGPPVLLT